MRWQTIALLLAACGNNAKTNGDAGGDSDAGIDAFIPPAPDPDDTLTSGTRIKIVWNVSPDGVKTFAGFHDAQRDEDCTPVTWSDNRIYCTPLLKDVTVTYSGTHCTMPVAFRGSNQCDGVPNYLPDCGGGEWCLGSINGTFQSGRLVRLFARGASNTLSGPLNISASGAQAGTCDPTPDGGTFYQLGAVVTQADLVEMTVGAPMGAGRLETTRIETVDGLRAPASFYDTEFRTECTATANATQPHCRPHSVIGSSGGSTTDYFVKPGPFSDPRCIQQVAKTSTPNRATFVQRTDLWCNGNSSAIELSSVPAYSYFGTGTEVSSLYEFTSVNNSWACELTTSDTATYYMPGDMVSPAMFDVVTESIPGRRLQRELLTAPGFATRLTATELEDVLGTRQYLSLYAPSYPRAIDPLGVLFDTQLQTDCTFEPIDDGTTACVPIHRPFVFDYFSDSNCMNPIKVVLADCALGAPFVTGAIIAGAAIVSPTPALSCPLSPLVRTLGTIMYDDVYEMNSGSCRKTIVGGHYVVTAIPDALVRATRMVEP